MKKKSIILIGVLCFLINSKAQNVGIGTSTPKDFSKLDIQSTNSGFNLPSMTSAQRATLKLNIEALSASVSISYSGMMVYDTDDNTMYMWDATKGTNGNWNNMLDADVTLDDADADPLNEIQTLSYTKPNLTLSGSGGTIDLSNIDNAVVAGYGLTDSGTVLDPTINANVTSGLHIDTPLNEIRLGGPLTETTTITQGNFDFRIDLSDVGDFHILDNNVRKFTVIDNGNAYLGGDMYWRDSNTNGTILGFFGDDTNDGRFQIMENGSVAIDLDANTASVFNQQGLDRDFRIESNNQTYMFNVDASADRISVGGTTTSGMFGIIPANENYGYYSDHNKTTAGSTYGMFIDLDNTYNGEGDSYGIRADATKTGVSNSTLYGGFFRAVDNQTSSGTRVAAGVYGYSYTSSTAGTSHSRGVVGWCHGPGADYKYAGYFLGDVYCGGIYQTSDKRLKSNIKKFKGALDQLALLDVKTYNFKTNRYPLLNLPKGNQIGLLSQDVQKIFPHMVSRADDTPKLIPLEDAIDMKIDYRKTDDETMVEVGEHVEILALDYTKLVPVLIKAIQEQQEQIEELKSLIK